MRIIAFGYKKGRGKDSCCNFMKDWLHRHHPDLRVRKVGFADKLKDVAHQLYGWAGLQPGIYYENRYKEKEIPLPLLKPNDSVRLSKAGLSPRDVWIEMGNKMREIYGPTWIHFITKGGITADVLLVKDMGFWNEAIEIRESGGLLYNVMRPDMPMANDPRETELDTWSDWDGIVDNGGDLNDLHVKITSLCEGLFGS